MSLLSTFSIERLASIAISVVLVMFSATLHEIAHGYAALKCGDATAKEAGRLTLNPAAHLDGFGSIALPLLMALMGGPMFAFAKPVPYNPRRLRNPSRDEVIVALAGPASNILQALAGTAVFGLVWGQRLAIASAVGSVGVYWAVKVFTSYIYVNLSLAFFNLIPFPPLDGSKVVMPLLKGEAKAQYYRIQAYAMPVLIAVLYVLPSFLNIDPVGRFLDLTAGNLYDLLLQAVM
ncbi:site-2 protease family protein [Paratractidigestivibacter sp.]|uniref:site-2 protease family protein n=1 Tax=Paratractidigestivibacter sp. TaxID=2847316 RepID=UPI002ABDC7A8|nr:site-2 protease family protein [Paratractidigestivibacter sp.]